MPGPTLIFGFVLATFLGALFHLILGGDSRRLAAYLLASWLGFVLGHVIGLLFGIEIFSLGPLRAGMAVAGSLFALWSSRSFNAAPRRRRAAR